MTLPGRASSPDVLVVGAGIVGLALARELKHRYPGARIQVLEKEDRLAAHSSGRNSGVLHAGFYYTPDSFKARLTRRGNVSMTRFCQEEGLPIRTCGKLVVTRSADELPRLQELFRRAEANGVPVERVSEEEARKIDPLVRTHGEALFSPTTSSVDPVSVVQALARDCFRSGIGISLGEAFLDQSGGSVRTTRGSWRPGFVVNAAGIHADRIARSFGFGEGYTMLPFKGVYLYGSPAAPPLSLHVYPVPDLRQPFLGTHFTVTVEGRVKIGPTATPALGREHYAGVTGVEFRDLREILGWEARLFLGNDFGFRDLALSEVLKLSREHLVREAGRMVKGVEPSQFTEWGRPGIRGQLFDTRTRSLVMDFLFQGDDRSLHVLNAVSPAFTSAFPLAELLADQVEQGVAA